MNCISFVIIAQKVEKNGEGFQGDQGKQLR